VTRAEQRLLAKLKADPRVESVWHEDSPDSWWLELKPGYRWEGCLDMHEDTLQGLLDVLGQAYKVDSEGGWIE
jgi:hypothetical protein